MSPPFPNGDRVTHEIHIDAGRWQLIQTAAKAVAAQIVSTGAIAADNSNKQGENIQTAISLAMLQLHQKGIEITPYMTANTPHYDRLVSLATQHQALLHYPLAQQIVAELASPWVGRVASNQVAANSKDQPAVANL